MTITITEACVRLHEIANSAPTTDEIPSAGLYLFLESGEVWGHGEPIIRRVSRCGSHRKQGRLLARAKEHFTQNSNGSVVIKHFGSALARRQAPESLCAHWGEADSRRCPSCKTSVEQTRSHLRANITEVVVGFNTEWEEAEKIAIGILVHCERCTPSKDWLGHYCLNPVVRRCGQWTDKHADFVPTEKDIDWLFANMGQVAILPGRV
jgi:hypothetical protein